MEKNTVFVDTGAWFALADKSDRFHHQSVSIYPILLKSRSLITTNLVIAETYNLIHRALGHRAAIVFLENIAASPRIINVYSDRASEEAAQEILQKYDDQDFSYTDAVSFSIMKQYKISDAFSFDRHFSIAGFTILP